MSRWRITRAGGLVQAADGTVLAPLTLIAASGDQEAGVLALTPGEAEILHAQLTLIVAPVRLDVRQPEVGPWAAPR